MGWTPITDDLRRLDPRELTVGRVTPADIVDRHGRVVLAKGTRFDPEHAYIFEQNGADGLFVGPNWPRPRTPGDAAVFTQDPDELIRALRRRSSGRGGPGRVRQHKRYAWSARIRVVAVIRTEGSVTNRPLTIETCDVSRSGFAFNAPLFLYEGTTVYAFFDMLPGGPTMKGIVRNCRLVEGRIHRVGVEFVPLTDGEIPPL